VHGDPLIRRIGRSSVLICLAATTLAFMLFGRWMAAAVLGGGLLIGISFYTIGSGVSAIVAAASGGVSSRKTVGLALLKLVLRYALLGFLAYVMIARLRMHPIGLLVGASSVPAAAFVEAVRLLAKKTS
jgi:hypothetical protein